MTVHCVSWVILKYLDVGPVPAWLPSPAWGQAGLRASSTLPLRQYVSKQDKCLSQCKRAMEKWKRKGYYDRMEIIVSNFKLDSSEKGVWERVGRGERKKKTILSVLMFGKREKLSQLVWWNLNAETDSLVYESVLSDCEQPWLTEPQIVTGSSCC